MNFNDMELMQLQFCMRQTKDQMSMGGEIRRHSSITQKIEEEMKLQSSQLSSRLRNIGMILDKFFPNGPVFRAPTERVDSLDEAMDFTNKAIEAGQEGAILRMIDSPYIHKRSKNILKLKKTLN